MSKYNIMTMPETMSSKEIAELVESRHDSVKRAVERLVEAGAISQPPLVDGIKSANGVVEKVYMITKRDTYVVVAQLSPTFTARLVDRWQELEMIVLQENNRRLARMAAASGYLPMSQALHDLREDEGKDTKFFHYSNEADMINKIVLGLKAKKYLESRNLSGDLRSHLTKSQISAIEELQRVNTVYIEDGVDFEERKKRLVMRFSKIKDRLFAIASNSTLRLSA